MIMRDWLAVHSTVDEMTRWGPAVVRALAALIDPLMTDEGEEEHDPRPAP